MKVPNYDLNLLLSDFGQLQRFGVPYGYGAKAEGGRDPRDGHKWNPRSTGHLSTPIDTINNLDCSGCFRYLSYRSTRGELVLPDGSQAQREFFEQAAKIGLVHQVSFLDVNRYMTSRRLFAGFIRPGYNGCGAVGHVFFGLNTDHDVQAETIESYGGHGVGSRPWLTGVLKRETYIVFELPTIQGSKP